MGKHRLDFGVKVSDVDVSVLTLYLIDFCGLFNLIGGYQVNLILNNREDYEDSFNFCFFLFFNLFYNLGFYNFAQNE